ncbi:IclR family transcriptional regulator [Psychrobacter sp. Cmf 22.2]|uniref:IclR family transcriptional regulator n=1 Tax=Psychrobacter sp. Cmf 22.2 TaxID=1926478 RepID=UPI0009470E0B|nr:IclR family transcriptional regulator [Psychrobacter sp. Cmf 22.2]OLF36164.1 IclR family transcriptional regulator [Psychrobacter sp. Cmf 22.2]
MSSTAVPALDKTFQILDLITASAQPLTAAHIAKELELPRSSTHNILQSLLTKHVIYKDTENRFHLGSYLMYWAGKYEQQQGVIQLFKDLIVQYPALLQHTVTLSKLDLGEVIFLACHEAPAPLGFTFRAGVRVPAVFSATGKAMLSTLPIDTIETIYEGQFPKPLTPNGVDNFVSFADEMAAIHDSRISLDDGQLREGMYCLGTYIRNASGHAVAGMAVSFLQIEYEAKRAEVSAVLIELAKQIEQRLGFIPSRSA